MTIAVQKKLRRGTGNDENRLVQSDERMRISLCHLDHIVRNFYTVVSRPILVQRLEKTVFYVEQSVRLAILDELAMAHDRNLVEVKDCVEFVRHSNNSM